MSDRLSIARMRLPSWPVWLISMGAVLAAAGVASIAYSVGFNGARISGLLRPGGISPLAALLALLVLVGGAVFSFGLIAYVVRGSLSHARAEKDYTSLGTILACFGVAIIVSNVLMIPYALVEAQRNSGEALSLTPGGLVLSVITLDGSLLGVLYFRLVRPAVLSWQQMGVTLASFWDRARLGVAVGIFVIVATAAVTFLLEKVGVQQTQQDLFAGVRGASPGQFLGVLLAAAAIVPVAEEIFFRGYVFTAVRQRWGLVPAFATSGLLFAVAHLNLEAFLPILLIGVTFCWVYWRTGSLVPSMIAHAMNNALALSTLLLSK
jgi:membrane protease YdiL (CAAX protease family)